MPKTTKELLIKWYSEDLFTVEKIRDLHVLRIKNTTKDWTGSTWYSQDEVDKINLELKENQQISDRISTLIKERDERYTKDVVEQLRKELKEKIEECGNQEEAKDLIDSVFDKVIRED